MKPEKDLQRAARKLAALLRRNSAVNEEKLEAVLNDTAGFNVDLPFVLAKRGLISEMDIANHIGETLKIPVLNKIDTGLVVPHIPFFAREQMEKYRSIPLDIERSGVLPRITLVMSNPFIIDQMLDFSGRATFSIQVAPASVIRKAIDNLNQQKPQFSEAQAILDTLLNAGLVTKAQLDWAKNLASETTIGKHSESVESKPETPQGIN